MNNGAAGYDGVFTDERARKAVAHGLDRELINERLTDGLGQPTSALLAESSRFYDGQQAPPMIPSWPRTWSRSSRRRATGTARRRCWPTRARRTSRPA